MAWDAVWDAVYSANRWGRYPPEDLVRFVARHFYAANDRKDVRLLEIGCGPAANLWYIAREGFSAYGLDGSAVALDKAKEVLEQEGVCAQLAQGEAMALPYDDGFFDGVIDMECVYANDKADSKKIIAEVHRVLKPGGYFYSRTFMDGTKGINQERGVARLTTEKEIPELYGVFPSIDYDYIIRTDGNRRAEMKEWLITCRK